MIVTENRLRELSQWQRLEKSATTETILHESVTSSFESYDIFLSHSSMDSDLILGVKSLLEKYGFSVYVDWVDDPQLIRSSVNSTSASIIRSRMQCSSMLVYAHTNNSAKSKWCPWELGFFDGSKGGNIFIFPISNRPESSFKGQEYLGLYPYIDEAPTKSGVEQLWINFGNSSVNLAEAKTKLYAPLYRS